MTEEAGSFPPISTPLLDPKTGLMAMPWYKFFRGQRGGIRNVNSGVSAVVAAQQQAEANAQAAAAAANAAAQAAIAASGSTTTDQDDFSNQSCNSGTFATYATCNITTTGAGNYTISNALSVTVLTDTPLVDGSGTFHGEWRIIESPGATVLFSGTFTVVSTANGGEGGSTFYTNDITFGTPLPDEDTVASVNVGANTVEFQLRRASGTNQVLGLFGSELVTWA